ncbi:DUF2336 domain-containing protein [Minwuia sp.]|uniref:DUF2336 domain-containing protein n=1 Tax=Minwuia sp. TaxID=2493630 RepID=UPI003A93D842
MQQQISENDVHALVGALSDGHKAAVGEQVARLLKRSGMSPDDLKIALQMIDSMIADSVESVRKGLAAHIAESPMLPRPMVERLLNDIDDVALPIVQFSPLLEDADMIRQLERGARFQEAVAARPDVSEPVAAHLVETAGEKAVGILVGNREAKLNAPVLDRAVDRFPDSVEVMGAVARRPGLPLEVAEKLVSLTVAEQCIQAVSDLMMETLIRRHDLPSVLAEDLVVHGRERSVVDMVRQSDDWSGIESLVERMHAAGRLSTSLMLRVLASGDEQFFVAGMAQLSRMSRERVVAAINGAGVDPFRHLYEKSGLEPMLFHAFRVARDEMRAARKSSGGAGGEAFIDRVVARITEEYRSISPAGLEQALSRLRRKAVH